MTGSESWPAAPPGPRPEARTDYDLVFVGSGISSTFTLLGLLDRLEVEPPGEPVRVAIVEQSGEFFTGVPYGDRSGSLALIITPLGEFLPQDQREPFFAWLAENRHWLIEDTRKEAGPRSAAWFDQLLLPVNPEAWDPLYVPRRFFGFYLAERAERAIDRARRLRLAHCDLIEGEVVAIERSAKHQRVVMADRRCLETSRVVLSTGSTPTKPLAVPAVPPGSYLVDDLYQPSLGHHLERIRALAASQPLRAVVIGANASALEIIYKLTDDPVIASQLTHVSVLSRRGAFPDPFAAPAVVPVFCAAATEALAERQVVTADQLADAIAADLDRAEANGIPVSVTFRSMSTLVGQILPMLDPDEKLSFACHFGVEIGRRQRRAGPQYLGAASDLIEAGRLSLLAGSFSGLETGEDGLHFRFQPTDLEQECRSDGPVNLVVNCGGGASFGRDPLPPLLTGLAATTPDLINGSQRGLRVDDTFETQPGVHVIGPMLAGNVIGDRAVWHVEHCGRIAGFADELAGVLHQALVSTESGSLPGVGS